MVRGEVREQDRGGDVGRVRQFARTECRGDPIERGRRDTWCSPFCRVIPGITTLTSTPSLPRSCWRIATRPCSPPSRRRTAKRRPYRARRGRSRSAPAGRAPTAATPAPPMHQVVVSLEVGPHHRHPPLGRPVLDLHGPLVEPALPQLTAFPTTTSSPPHRLTAASTAAAIVSGSFRSIGTTYAVPPAPPRSPQATPSATSFCELYVIATFAPSRQYRSRPLARSPTTRRSPALPHPSTPVP